MVNGGYMFKKIIFAMFLLLMPAILFSQEINQIEWLSQLDSKAIATFGDGKKLFYMTFPEFSEKHKASPMDELNKYSDNSPLTRGMIAAIIARELNLKGSFLYILTGWERYACRACIAEGIMNSDSSENDPISGPELLDIMIQAKNAKGRN
jgi:hypothetical protein